MDLSVEKYEVLLSNIYSDKPNTNGRIYPKHILQKIVDDINSKETYIVYEISNSARDAAGKIHNASLTEKNRISIKFSTFNNQKGGELNALCDLYIWHNIKLSSFVPRGTDEIDEGKNIINYNLNYILVINEIFED